MATPTLPECASRPSRDWRADLVSGFLVFLIALPLCLAISLASGMPATAGILTAIVGGLICPFLSNSELTIKGPAAGLIVIVIGCVMEFGGSAQFDASVPASVQAYRLTLGVAVVAGVLQIGFALARSSIISSLFPTAAVHGMLASIGVIIIAKQAHLMLGVSPHGKEPLHLLAEIPKSLMSLNPEIALIGGSSLLLLFLWPVLRRGYLKVIPGQILVLVLGVALGFYFDLHHSHRYTVGTTSYELSPKFLVSVPENLSAAIMTPDFSGVLTPIGWKWIIMFALIGSLESVLSAKAIDLLDPERRKSNLNRDLLAVGLGNAVAACIGGLPMISEIVRSKANIDNGAKSRWANSFHSLFLLVFVALAPALIHCIPLAVLAAMLVYTGFRLASPREFLHMYRAGSDPFIVFNVTIVAVLATDLLMGIAVGLAVQLLLHWLRGVSLSRLWRHDAQIDQPDESRTIVYVNSPAVFSTWLGLRRDLLAASGSHEVIVDFTGSSYVDHSVRESLRELQDDFQAEQRTLQIVGLSGHSAQHGSSHATTDHSRPTSQAT